jgi:hypothetical protein
MGMEQWWNDDWQGETKELREKSAPVPLHPLQISLEVTWDWTRISVMRSQHLAALAMAQPQYLS